MTEKREYTKATVEKHKKIAEQILNEEFEDLFVLYNYYCSLSEEAINLLKVKSKTRKFNTLLKFLNISNEKIKMFDFIIERLRILGLRTPKYSSIKSCDMPKFLDVSDYQYKKIVKEKGLEPIEYDSFRAYGQTLYAPVFNIFSVAEIYQKTLTDPKILLKKIKERIKPYKIDFKKNIIKYVINVGGLIEIGLYAPFETIDFTRDLNSIIEKLEPAISLLDKQKSHFKESISTDFSEFIEAGISLYWNKEDEMFYEEKQSGEIFDLNKKQKLNFNKAIRFFDKIKKVGFNKFNFNVEDLKFTDQIEAMKNKKRKFVFILGDTNSGKTHEAMESLKNAKTGIYLSPIRLLSYEKYKEMSSAGLETELKTGEESILNKEATHFCSTVELVDPSKKYEVGVIDEIQMIDDAERGSAWLKAIMSLNAEVIYVLGSYDFYLRQRLIEFLKYEGFEVEIKSKKRLSELNKLNQPVSVQKLEQGDAIIAFDKNTLFCLAYEMKKNNISCSVLFGELPYDRKLEEIDKFINGEVKVLIATDVIAMGINMPIKRVLFYKTYKYNGCNNESISVPLFKQIVGRAGRYKENGFYGLYVSDFVNGLMHNNDLTYMKAKNNDIFNSLSAKIDHIYHKDQICDHNEFLLSNYNYGFDLSILEKLSEKNNGMHFYQILKLYKIISPFDCEKANIKSDLKIPFIFLLNEIVSVAGVHALFKLLSFNSATQLFNHSSIEDWKKNIDYKNAFIEERVAKILGDQGLSGKIKRYSDSKEMFYEKGWSYYARDLSFKNYDHYDDFYGRYY